MQKAFAQYKKMKQKTWYEKQTLEDFLKKARIIFLCLTKTNLAGCQTTKKINE